MDQSGTSPPEALPKWLTEDYFRSLFRRKSPREEVAVQNVTVKFADEERIHGKLIRVAVDVVTPRGGAQTLPYVVKRPGPGQFSSTPACANMYRMEALVLGEVIPAMEKVLDAVAPGKFGQLAPRLVDYGIDDNLFIMTEDLSVQGFSTVDRQVGLDLEHCLAHVKHLAAFHAASVAVLERYESEIKAIPLLIDSEEVRFLNEFIATSMKGVESVIDSWEDGAKFADAVRRLGASLPSRLAQANRACEGLRVLCHGDMFVNNVLFREGAAGVVDAVRLVDFQLARVGSFADDLAGALVSAASDGVLQPARAWEHAAEAYREALNAALHALGHGARALSQEALRDALRAQRAVAQFALFHVLPRSRAPAPADPGAHHAPAYRALLRDLLPRFRELRWLDESPKTTVNNVTRVPSWLNQNYFQLLLQQQSTGANLRVLRVNVTRIEAESTSTTDVFQAAVEVSFPSGVDTKIFRVKCPGNGLFNKMSTESCMLKMDPLILGKLLPIAEEIIKGAVSGTVNSQARLLDRNKNSKPYVRNRDQAKPTRYKSSDLKFCLAVVRHLALLHAASMIALDHNTSRISDIPEDFSLPVLKDLIRTSFNTIFSHLATQHVEKKDKGEITSEPTDESVHLNSEDAIVKYKVKLDSQKTVANQEDVNELKTRTEASNELVQPDQLTKCINLKFLPQEVSKTSNIGLKNHKTIFSLNRVNTPSYQLEARDNNKLLYQLETLDSRINDKLLYQLETIDTRDNNELLYQVETIDNRDINKLHQLETIDTRDNNKLHYQLETIDTRDNTTEVEVRYKPFSSKHLVLPDNTQDRLEDLQSGLCVHYPEDHISVFSVPRQASPPEEVGSRRARNTPSVHPFELLYLVHCGLNERILPRFNTSNFGLIYT